MQSALTNAAKADSNVLVRDYLALPKGVINCYYFSRTRQLIFPLQFVVSTLSLKLAFLHDFCFGLPYLPSLYISYLFWAALSSFFVAFCLNTFEQAHTFRAFSLGLDAL